MSRTRAWLLALLVATALAAYLAPPPQDVVAPSRGIAAEAATPQPVVMTATSEPEPVLSIHPRTGQEEVAPVFGTLAAPPPPAAAPTAAAAVPPPTPLPPQAPPLPFRAFGRYLDEGKAAVFVQYNDRNLVVRAGDRIDGQYLIEGVDERVVTLLYIPLNQRQTLDIGSAP